MVKDIEKLVLGNLNWLVGRFKSLTVKFIGFVVTCWLVIGAIWIGLVLPVNLVKGSMVKGNEAKVVVAREVMKQQVSDYRTSNVNNRVGYQVPVVVKQKESQPVVRDQIRNVTNTVNELRRFGQGVESLVGR